MRQILILTTTQYGQTTEIAKRIEKEIVGQGDRAHSISLPWSGTPPATDIADFDIVIMGSPVYVSKFSPALIGWAKSHREELTKKQVAFFSVSLNAADKRPEARIADQQLLNGFIAETGI